MRHMHNTHEHRNERGGIVLAFMGIALLVFMGLAVVAIDFGHLGLSTNEVQVVADTAATAGARSLMLNAMGATENPITVAQTVVASNHVDDGNAMIAASDVQVGTYDFTTRTFSTGGATPNAVRAIGRATVDNMIAGFFGDRTTDVQRTAIAAYGGNASARPVCPITVGVCQFSKFLTTGNCSDLPTLTQAPSGTDSSGYTSLGPLAASASEAVQYLPAACEKKGGAEPPGVHLGDTINVMNGQVSSVLKSMEDCFKAGLLTECVIPIVSVPCNGQFNQPKQVVGFATMKIKAITTSGTNKGIDLDGICNSDEPGAPGGPNLGTTTMALVD